ncbi:MAG: alpha/beta hydrolase [Deltaproteobacteria bacterium]|nr:alpha/beta hydrolase [Deltaproteobacteria bacterium]
MDIPAEVARVHDDWGRRGRFVTLPEGFRIFAVQEGRGPDLVLLHGFPSSSHDFAAALPYLTRRFRVTTWDHLGFGFSDKPAGATSYSLLDQGRRAGEIARALGIKSARVAGHDMGLTIAVEMLCRQEAALLGFSIEELALCNGSHLVELAHLTPFQQVIMTAEGAAAFALSFDPEQFAQGFRFLWADPLRTPAVDLRAIAYWLQSHGGLDILGRIARYNLERTQYAERWRPILARTPVPIRVIWGDQDPIAVLEIGRRLAEMSGGPLTVLEGIGHYPQMEAPEEWAAALTHDWV